MWLFTFSHTPLGHWSPPRKHSGPPPPLSGRAQQGGWSEASRLNSHSAPQTHSPSSPLSVSRPHPSGRYCCSCFHIDFSPLLSLSHLLKNLNSSDGASPDQWDGDGGSGRGRWGGMGLRGRGGGLMRVLISLGDSLLLHRQNGSPSFTFTELKVVVAIKEKQAVRLLHAKRSERRLIYPGTDLASSVSACGRVLGL